MLEEKLVGSWFRIKKMASIGIFALGILAGGNAGNAYAEEPEIEPVTAPGAYAARGGSGYSEENGVRIPLNDWLFLRPFSENAYLFMDQHSPWKQGDYLNPENQLVGSGLDLEFKLGDWLRPYLRGEMGVTGEFDKKYLLTEDALNLNENLKNHPLTSAEAGAGLRFEFDLGDGLKMGLDGSCSYNNAMGPIYKGGISFEW